MQWRLKFFTKYLRQMNNDRCEHDCSSTVSSEWNNMKLSAKMKVVGGNFLWKLLAFFMEKARSLHTWCKPVFPWNSMNFMYCCYKFFFVAWFQMKPPSWLDSFKQAAIEIAIINDQMSEATLVHDRWSLLEFHNDQFCVLYFLIYSLLAKHC